ANVFFSFEGANPEAWDQLHSQVVGDTLQLKWEGAIHGGDGSYTDFVMSARGLVLPSGGGQGAYAYTAQAQDVEGDPITYTVLSAPAGAGIDMHTGQISFQAVIGQYDFVIGADDGQGGHAEQAFHLTVNAQETPNTVTAFSVTPTGF